MWAMASTAGSHKGAMLQWVGDGQLEAIEAVVAKHDGIS